jgi:hypothetical protein
MAPTLDNSRPSRPSQAPAEAAPTEPTRVLSAVEGTSTPAEPTPGARPRLFSERIRTRQRVWWAKPNKWRNRESYRHPFHRFKETHTLRRKDDPENKWHCCGLWQRSLSNKWNAREFVQMHGCRVPALYWYGRRAGALPLDALPSHFDIRPAWGTATRGVCVLAHDRDLLHDRAYSKDQLRAQVRRDQGRISRFPILVEEFVKTETGDYALPIEYKCYTFGSTVGAIEVVQGAGRDARHTFYTASWEAFADQMSTHYPRADDIGPPRCLEEILACARTLGGAYGTFVRVDCYATDRGCVFGEFSSTPMNGLDFTAFADTYFGELWDATFPDRT